MCDIYIYIYIFRESYLHSLKWSWHVTIDIYFAAVFTLSTVIARWVHEFSLSERSLYQGWWLGGLGVMWTDLANTTTRGSQGRSSWGISGAWRCVCAVQLSRPSCSTLYIRVSEAIDELVLIVGVIDVGVTPFLSLVYNVSEHYQIEAQMGQSSRSFRYWPDLTA